MGRLATQLGNPSGSLLVSSNAFEDAVVQQLGSVAFAQRLYESQDPSAHACLCSLPRGLLSSSRHASKAAFPKAQRADVDLSAPD